MISPHVVDAPSDVAALGALAAAGPRAAAAPGEYEMVIEAIREGYLLHYAKPRLLAGVDDDLALLAGDYLYALGLERLAALEDLDAVGELADLISLVAHAHGRDREPRRARREADALWIATAVAVGAGASDAHASAKASLREGAASAADDLWAAASQTARAASLESALARAADAIDFRGDPLS